MLLNTTFEDIPVEIVHHIFSLIVNDRAYEVFYQLSQVCSRFAHVARTMHVEEKWLDPLYVKRSLTPLLNAPKTTWLRKSLHSEIWEKRKRLDTVYRRYLQVLEENSKEDTFGLLDCMPYALKQEVTALRKHDAQQIRPFKVLLLQEGYYLYEDGDFTLVLTTDSSRSGDVGALGTLDAYLNFSPLTYQEIGWCEQRGFEPRELSKENREALIQKMGWFGGQKAAMPVLGLGKNYYYERIVGFVLQAMDGKIAIIGIYRTAGSESTICKEDGYSSMLTAEEKEKAAYFGLPYRAEPFLPPYVMGRLQRLSK